MCRYKKGCENEVEKASIHRRRVSMMLGIDFNFALGCLVLYTPAQFPFSGIHLPGVRSLPFSVVKLNDLPVFRRSRKQSHVEG